MQPRFSLPRKPTPDFAAQRRQRVANSHRHSHEKMAGDMLFYHSGEIHQTLPGTARSKCINLEVEHGFMDRTTFRKKPCNVRPLAGPRPSFWSLKMYKELSADDPLTQPSLQLLFLGMMGRAQTEVSQNRLSRPKCWPCCTTNGIRFRNWAVCRKPWACIPLPFPEVFYRNYVGCIVWAITCAKSR